MKRVSQINHCTKQIYATDNRIHMHRCKYADMYSIKSQVISLCERSQGWNQTKEISTAHHAGVPLRKVIVLPSEPNNHAAAAFIIMVV